MLIGADSSPQQVADAVRRGGEPIIYRGRDCAPRYRLEAILGDILEAFVYFVGIRPHRGQASRFILRSIPYDDLACRSNAKEDDMEGKWVQLDPRELELAIV